MAGSSRNSDSAPDVDPSVDPESGARSVDPESGARSDSGTSGSGSAPDEGHARGSTISRRRLIGTAGATGVVLGAAGLGGGYAAAAGTRDEEGARLASVGDRSVGFEGARQPGITTAAQAHCHLVAFDLVPSAGRTEAAALLRRWSATARRLMAGHTLDDSTGIALDAGPSSLTVTFGFGHSFFARTGLEAQRPGALDPLPDFSSDRLDPKRSNGDLWVQIGADDALVAFDALRSLQREAGKAARVRWQMNGFNRSPGATARPMTTRNLMGQVDGTNNPQESDDDFRERLFATGEGARRPAWMAGGSYAVVRRIRMLLDDWDGLSSGAQEQVIGRRKKDGAPLSGGSETTEPKLDAVGKDGKLLVASDAHARISRPDQNGGAAMLRRPFSFHDGYDADGVPDAGLLFIAWQADPHRGFVPVQRKLDRGDALSKFIRHESSAVFAVPRGARNGEYVGQELLEG
ncbi:Dye-decolorizing peroxidase precursor [Streptomyces sp. YIM 130001]|uniref:iron uptake transporter deferrochelatase/peroxidase subunit n=1 Tax=Streptomyces sp. YIM 130001 TaxID=2259644 RepID=UPI000E6537EC|nr:iron uptake transporter deferrochelatase/peroxidase subunit [Streptomyces sp. YIM 130001]RII11912.1 Dye-decolorizing peroxidase precursor [Streptomyces sp. YIM 130001]